MSSLRFSLLNNRLLFGGMVFFGMLAMTGRHAIDPDLWWHLRTGQWIVETGHIPRTDPFSFTRGGSPWISHEWLSELFFYLLWKVGGFTALIFASSIVTSVGFVFLYARCAAKPHWAAAATVLGATAAAPCWGVRPQMFTFTLASVFLWLIERSQTRPRILLWLPPLFILWLNLHAGFALGPALLLSYSVGIVAEVVVGTTSWRDAKPAVMRLFTATAACLALVPLNPSGVRLYRYPFDTLRSPTMRSLIVEWFSPDFHLPLYLPLLLILLLLLAGVAKTGPKIKGRVLLPLLLGCFAALDAARHIPIFVLLGIPVLANQFGGSPSMRRPFLSPSPSLRRFPVFRMAVMALLTAFAAVRWASLARSQTTSEAQEFPKSAINFLRSHPQPPRIFAYNDWGGYLIWNSYPQNRVLVDGRADLYGDALLRECQNAMLLHNGWQATLLRWDVDTVLIPPGSALSQALILNPAWSKSYQDSRSVVFVRVGKPSAPYATDLPIKGTQR
jgi:hypothetical protein